MSGTPTTIFTMSVLATANAGIPGPTNAPSSTAFFTISPSKGAIRDVSRRAISASLVKARADFSLLLAGVVLGASGIEVGFREALSVIQMRSAIKVELCFLKNSFRGCCLRRRLVYLVLVFRRSDADEHRTPADSIPFRDVAHPAVLAAHLLERNDVSRNSE